MDGAGISNLATTVASGAVLGAAGELVRQARKFVRHVSQAFEEIHETNAHTRVIARRVDQLYRWPAPPARYHVTKTRRPAAP